MQHFSQEPGFLMPTLLSNSQALHKTPIIVNLSIRCWESDALTSRMKGRISLLMVSVKLLEWKCSAVHISVCVQIPTEKQINKYMCRCVCVCAHVHTRLATQIDIRVEKEYAAKIFGTIFLKALL